MSSVALQLDVFTTEVYSWRVEAAPKQLHFFKMDVQRDLFGGAVLIIFREGSEQMGARRSIGMRTRGAQSVP
jgi:hypothetical protein